MELRRKFFVKRSRPGYIMLLGGLLVLVFIGMVVYFMKMHGPVYEIGVGKSDIDPPWRQWEKMQIRYRKEPVGEPTVQQLQLSSRLEVIAHPQQDGKRRGRIEMLINTDGKIAGVWGGEYDISKDVDFQVMACKFEGNIDPEKVYYDEEGDNPTKLFFLARGLFSILETNDDSGQVRNVTGEAFVRGWLNPNRTIEGELILTSDEKNFHRYTWKALAKKPEKIPFF